VLETVVLRGLLSRRITAEATKSKQLKQRLKKRLKPVIILVKKPRYNFETHVSKHLKAHLDIEKATGTALAENTKVRKLLYSLRCATMNVLIGTIQAQENLRNSFDESINYLRAFILSTSHGDDRNVSGVSARSTTFKRKDGYDKTAKKGKFGNNNGNKPLDWYYKPDEWWKLSEEVRAKILVLRKNRN
jgi:hypothetical protein